MNARWPLASGVAAAALLATGGAAVIGLAAVVACGVVVLLAAVCAVACLGRALPGHLAPELPPGVATPLVVVATMAYLVVAPVALHLVGLRLTTVSAALVAMALPVAALCLRDVGRIEGRAALGSGALVAALAGGVVFAPAVERYVDVTTPSTEFSSLSFARPLAGGATRTAGPVQVEVVYDGPGVSPDDVAATFAGEAVTPRAVTTDEGTHRIRYRMAVPSDGCEHVLEVRAVPVAPGRSAAVRGDEAALDDASRSTLRLAARFVNDSQGAVCG
ncbi:MAG: hypothetical protein M3P85_12495 [Actinomycetota bacterium]|nr:hypothetical protein [Actinomycetota bacterium]